MAQYKQPLSFRLLSWVLILAIPAMLAALGFVIYSFFEEREREMLSAERQRIQILDAQDETREQARRIEQTIIDYIECVVLIDATAFNNRERLQKALRICAFRDRVIEGGVEQREEPRSESRFVQPNEDEHDRNDSDPEPKPSRSPSSRPSPSPSPSPSQSPIICIPIVDICVRGSVVDGWMAWLMTR